MEARKIFEILQKREHAAFEKVFNSDEPRFFKDSNKLYEEYLIAKEDCENWLRFWSYRGNPEYLLAPQSVYSNTQKT